MTSTLENVQALTFDCFGTVVDWYHTVSRLVKEKAAKSNIQLSDEDSIAFAKEWRLGYYNETQVFRLSFFCSFTDMQTRRSIAAGAKGPASVDVMHRQASRIVEI